MDVTEIPHRVQASFWSKVDVGSVDDCWLWKLSVGSHGYGQIGWSEYGRTRTVLAHRTAYVLTVGPIPHQLTIDHLCRTRPCCNPAHMQLVTLAENSRLAGARMTECKNGHPFDTENTRYNDRGHRRCLVCMTNTNRARDRRKKVS